jgi:hypothetical protein
MQQSKLSACAEQHYEQSVIHRGYQFHPVRKRTDLHVSNILSLGKHPVVPACRLDCLESSLERLESRLES